MRPGSGSLALSASSGPALISVSGTHNYFRPVHSHRQRRSVGTTCAADSLTVSGAVRGGGGLSIGGLARSRRQ